MNKIGGASIRSTNSTYHLCLPRGSIFQADIGNGDRLSGMCVHNGEDELLGTLCSNNFAPIAIRLFLVVFLCLDTNARALLNSKYVIDGREESCGE